jgi:hypothetical protein
MYIHFSTYFMLGLIPFLNSKVRFSFISYSMISHGVKLGHSFVFLSKFSKFVLPYNHF